MERNGEILFDVLKEVQMVRHFLYVKKKRAGGGAELIYYDASSEEEIFKGRYHHDFFSLLKKKGRFFKVDFFTRNGLPAFSFKRD